MDGLEDDGDVPERPKPRIVEKADIVKGRD